MNRLSLSVTAVCMLAGKAYYDLPGTVELMRELTQEGVVNGYELQHLEEWDAAQPPRDRAAVRMAAWQRSAKYSVDQVADILLEAEVPIASIHGKRDAGILLCSQDTCDIERGRRMMHESMQLATAVQARVCVFHLWDTWQEECDLVLLAETLREVALAYPAVTPAIENVPTHLPGMSPFSLVERFGAITLDLRWAVKYHELGRFAELKQRIANVHIRGTLGNGEWMFKDAPLSIAAAIGMIGGQWGYKGLWTMEPEGFGTATMVDLQPAMRGLRELLHLDT